MLYAMKLEAIADHILYERRMCRKYGVAWQPKRMIEYQIRPAWVARIIGFQPDGREIRQFLRGRRDYSQATSTGSRGIWIHYLLDDGIYEVNEPVKWGQCRRYFLRVRNGAATEVVRRGYVRP